jgi:hypothetical protein
MEKDIGRVPRNPDTDIVIRVDDFNGRRGVTIREFAKSEQYTGFTKAGTRISAENFELFKTFINAIDIDELKQPADNTPIPQSPPRQQTSLHQNNQPTTQPPIQPKSTEPKEADSDEAGIDEDGFM